MAVFGSKNDVKMKDGKYKRNGLRVLQYSFHGRTYYFFTYISSRVDKGNCNIDSNFFSKWDVTCYFLHNSLILRYCWDEERRPTYPDFDISRIKLEMLAC